MRPRASVPPCEPSPWRCVCVCVCAAAYTWGVAGSNDCPPPSLRILDAVACRSAAAAAGKAYDGIVDEADYPRGCAWYSSGSGIYVRLNIAIGSGSSSAVLLCAEGTGKLTTRTRACGRPRIAACTR
jgi:hypothetical protein